MERTNSLHDVSYDQKIWKVYLGQRWAECGDALFMANYNVVSSNWQEKGVSCWGQASSKELHSSTWNNKITVQSTLGFKLLPSAL